MRGRLPESPHSILVLKPSSFGDIIHTLPAVARLRERWPTCRISWLINTEWAPLLVGSPVIDEVILFPRQQFRGMKGLSRAWKWLHERITSLEPDLTLDFQGLLRTALIGRFTGGFLVGMADAREGARWFYDLAVPVPPGVPHAVERYLALSDAVTGGPSPASSARRIVCPLPPAQAVEVGWGLKDRYVLLHPFARGKAKSLRANQVRALCTALAPRLVVLVGRCEQSAFDLPSNTVNLLNQTSLPQLLSLIAHASFVISVDSGPVHLAAAMQKPLVAIHSWSDPRRVGPYLPTAWVLKNGELLRVSELLTRTENFFLQPPGEILSPASLDAIRRLVTSSSDFSA